MVTDSQTLTLADTTYGPHHTLIIAELSANHNGSLDHALALVEAAAASGADAVKVQTFTADSMTLRSDQPEFQINGTVWHGRYLHDLYADAAMPWKWQTRLAERCRELGMHFFSSPFDDAAVDFLEELQVPAYKIASFEIVDTPLISKAAATGKPIIISTGMASLSEIEAAVHAARSNGASDVALLKCTSAYPCPPEQMNLRTISHLSQSFAVASGLSDHSMGIAVPVAAVALGAVIVEKHLTLRRADGGPDSAFSLEPDEFTEMVEAVRTTERALGHIHYGGTDADTGSRVYRRSLYCTADMRAGDRFTSANVRSIRPGYGLPPSLLPEVLKCHASVNLKAGTALRRESIDWRSATHDKAA